MQVMKMIQILIVRLWLMVVVLSWGFGYSDEERFIICIGNNEPATIEAAKGGVNCTISFASFEEANLEITVTNSTTVILIDENMVLKESISIMDKDNIKITGRRIHGTNSTTQILYDSGNTTGLKFTQVRNLTLSNLSMRNCGGKWVKTTSNEGTTSVHDYIHSTLYLVNCSYINIDYVTIDGSKGHAIAMIDCFEKVHIYCSLITNNHKNESITSAGLYITIERNDTVYRIHNCQFLNNHINFNQSMASKADKQHDNHLKGGGMSIEVGGNSYSNQFNITDCLFYNNMAMYGGGLHVQIENNASRTVTTLERVQFCSNRAVKGGGGLDIRVDISKPNRPKNNEVHIHNSVFEKNSGSWGGGTTFFAELSYGTTLKNIASFKNCSWKRNLANIGSAFFTLPPNIIHAIGSFPATIEMYNCSFVSNVANGSTLDSTVYTRLIPFKVGNTTFKFNKGSGMAFIDSSITVMENSFVSFIGNSGSFGGGMCLIGLSKIITETNVILTFIKNHANFRGGAIYVYSLHKLFTIDTQDCFIKHASHYNISHQPKFYFNGNKASQDNSNAMFLPSITSCACSSSHSVFDVLENCIGNFTFADGNITSQVGTIGSEFFNSTQQDGRTTIKLIPGWSTRLPFEIHDELGQSTFAVLSLAINEQTVSTSAEAPILNNSITVNNRITLMGQPNQTGSLQINSLYQNLAKEVTVVMSECPPGYINVNGTCVCSLYVSNEEHYETIIQCDSGGMNSYIINGFWVGYVTEGDEQAGEDNLYVAGCPFGYCYDLAMMKNNSGYKTQLPGVPSKELMDEKICQRVYRTGILCGSCIDGYTVYYHSPKYRCGPQTRYCNYGIIFYFLSELLPVTLLFTIVMLTGVNFNSGKLNGFVLFAQLLKSISTPANGVIKYSKTELFFHDLRVLLYEPFNLNFFEAESLSFCIHKNTNFLVVVAVEFATLVYSLVLVKILVILMNSKHCYKLQTACFKINTGIAKQSSLTNGIAAFFTLCYSSAAGLSFDILSVGQLIGKGERQLFSLRVFRSGNMVYFSGIHIPFAIGAILILLTIFLVPPVLLILYPVGLKVIPEKIQRKQPLRFLIWKAGLYMPLFDCFQGCFKDQHRYFAGVYFLYRSAFLVTYAFISSTVTLITVNQTIMSVMLALHLWIQPYKQQVYNMIDGLLFLLLTLINTLTMWRYFMSFTEGVERKILHVGIVQLVFIYTPGVAFVLYFSLHFIHKKISIRVKKTAITNGSTLLDSSTYHRRLD